MGGGNYLYFNLLKISGQKNIINLAETEKLIE
jgi:hypothetical protein